MRKKSVADLKAGMVVARPVYDGMRNMLLNCGVELKDKYIVNLKRMGVSAIYIEDDLIPDIEIEDVILDSTRQKANTIVREVLQGLGNGSSKGIPRLNTLKKEMSSVLDNIIEQLLSNSNLVVNLSDIRTSDEYTFAHSVNVAVLAITTAISLKVPRGELKKIGLGSMLHDMGKVKVPLSILNKNGPLSQEEFGVIKKHPDFGFDIVKLQDHVDKVSARVVMQHHEKANGNGYPLGLQGEEISFYARICTVTDVYDALVADRPYRKAFLPHKALEIMEQNMEDFDVSVLQGFYCHVAAYPVGTLVGLSSGETGVVIKNTAGFPNRPLVRVICIEEGARLIPVKPYAVDLMKVFDLVVREVYEEDKIPPDIIRAGRAYL